VPLEGAFPLSTSLDSIGPLANSLACCAIVDSVIAGEEPTLPSPIPLPGLRLAVPQRYVVDGLESAVAHSFESALRRLSDAGAQVVGLPFAELEELPSINAKGGFSAAECYATLRKLIATDSEGIDPRVLARIVRGAEISGPDYVDLVAARASLIARAAVLTAPFDAVAMPTLAVTAPAIAALAADDEYVRTNAAILRNPSVVNFLDRCALTLPCHEPGEAPVGLTLMGEHLGDRRLISIGLSCEAALRRE
jgi:aspartyl-tRNA(Asn)/glutamyl-tRNA(Gln) amidotransferase subunit A